MSSTIRIDDLGADHYEDEWNYFGLEDDPLKGGSPPSASVLDVNLGLSVPVRTCPSPLAQIPTREPYGLEPPPKLSPVPVEQEHTFTTLSTHVPDSSHQYSSSAPRSLAEYENDLAEELGIFPSQPSSSSQPTYMQPTTSTTYIQAATSIQTAPLQSASPSFVPRQQNDIHMMQPSTSGTQHNGAIMQQQQQQQASQQQQQQACIQAVNGQWYVQATQVQHVQSNSGGTVIVVPNFARGQADNNAQSGVTRQSPQQLTHQPMNMGMLNAQPQQQQQQPQHQQQQPQQPQQQQHGHHVMQQQQQRHQVMQASKPVPVSAMQSQGHPVVQQLLSAPALPRQQMQQPLTPQNVPTPQAKPKQRSSQPRSNGRKKNAGQNGTLGSFLTKANRLAAASNGASSETNRSSHDSVTLSVQNLEQVSKLTKDINRFQTLQSTQGVDYSREIKDLESKRAQIFFAALVEQHKNEDILSAASGQPKPPPRPTNTPRQRNNTYSANSRSQIQPNVQVQHQVQPSTSYERQPTFENPQQHPGSRPYTTSYQTVHYQSYQPPNRNAYNAVPVSSSPHVQQQAPVQQQYYHTAGNVRQDVCNTYTQNYEQTHSSNAAVTQVPLQQSQSAVSQPAGTTHQPVLVSPPRLRSSAETAAAVNEKRQQRDSKVNSYMSALQKSIESLDLSKPFEDLPDVFTRLLPFHMYDEPALNDQVLDQFDHEYLRRVVYLNERKERVEKRLRTILCGEAMRNTAERMDELVLLSLDGEYESRLLSDDRRFAAENPKEFVSGSQICAQMKEEDLQLRKAGMEKRSAKPQMPFEYHAFSEAQILARDRGNLSDSESEKEADQYMSDDESTSENSASCSEESELSLMRNESKQSTFVPSAVKVEAMPVKENLGTKVDATSTANFSFKVKLEPPDRVAATESVTIRKNVEDAVKQDISREMVPSKDVAGKMRINGVVAECRKERSPKAPSGPIGQISANVKQSPQKSLPRPDSVNSSMKKELDLQCKEAAAKPRVISSLGNAISPSKPVTATQSKAAPVSQSKVVPAVESKPVQTLHNKSAPVIQSKVVPVVQSKAVPAAQGKKAPPVQNKAVPAAQGKAVPAAQGKAVPAIQSKAAPAVQSKAALAVQSKAAPAVQSKAVSAPHNKATPGASSTANTSNAEESQKEQPKCRSLKEKLKRHWNEEMSAEKKESPKPASEKLRLRFRPILPPAEKLAPTSKKVEYAESSPSPELSPAALPAPVEVLQRVSREIKTADSRQQGESITTQEKVIPVESEKPKAKIQPHLSDKRQTNGLLSVPVKIKCNLRPPPESVKPMEEKTEENRPPIRIKIALPARTADVCTVNEEEKSEKKKKKKKKRHHHGKDDEQQTESAGHFLDEQRDEPTKSHDVIPCCSELSEAARPPSTSTLDDPSRGRLLLRFSRKQNNVVKCEPASSPASSCTTQGTSAGTPTNMVGEELEPKPKVPKLKIPRFRLNKDFNTEKSDSPVTEVGEIENQAKADERRKTLTDHQTRTGGVGARIKGKVPKKEARPVKAEEPEDMPKSNASASCNSATVTAKCSTLTLNLFPSSSTSAAQFSPGSDASDVEEEKRLRQQTENVMNRLNGWGSTLPVTNQIQAEALSRFVNNASFMNPLLSGLMAPGVNPWLANIDQGSGFASARPFPWLVPPSLMPQGTPTERRNPTSFEKSKR